MVLIEGTTMDNINEVMNDNQDQEGVNGAAQAGENLWQQYQIYLSLSDIFNDYEPMTFEEYTALPQRGRV